MNNNTTAMVMMMAVIVILLIRDRKWTAVNGSRGGGSVTSSKSNG